MKVGSTNDLSSQLQALETAALGQYQSNQGFNFLLQQANQTDGSGGSSSSSGKSGSSSSSSSSTSQTSGSSGYQLSGSFTGDALIAVGTMSANGQMTPFSQQQVQSEESAVASARKSAYANALQNFMTLSQASGQMSGGTFTDQQSYVSANGMVSANFDTSLTLKPVGGGVPAAAS